MSLMDILSKSANFLSTSEVFKDDQGTIQVPDPVYALAVQKSSTARPLVAVGSFRQGKNDNYTLVDNVKYEQRHPPSKIAWYDTKVFGATSTSLRIWKVGDSSKPTLKLANTKLSPMTSFEFSIGKAATGHVNSTVSIWDMEKGKLDVQMIAHDKAVLDLKYKDQNHILTVSDDGSLRMFDLRDLDHSTIVYEKSDAPLIRVAYDSSDPNRVTVLPANSSGIISLDIRKISQTQSAPIVTKHATDSNACINSIVHVNFNVLCALSDGTCTVIRPDGTEQIVPQPMQYRSGGIVNIDVTEAHIYTAHDTNVSLINNSYCR